MLNLHLTESAQNYKFFVQNQLVIAIIGGSTLLENLAGKNSILHWFVDVKIHLSKFTRELIEIDRRMMTGERTEQGIECDYYYYISHNRSSFNDSTRLLTPV